MTTTRFEWWRQSTYLNCSMEWATGFAAWLRSEGWTVGVITEIPGGVHVPAIRILDAERIRKSPYVCGGSARIRDTRVPVWTLVRYRQLGLSDAGLMDSFSVDADDLAAAWLCPETVT